MEPGGEYDVILGIAESEYEGIDYSDHRDQWPMVQIIDKDVALYSTVQNDWPALYQSA